MNDASSYHAFIEVCLQVNDYVTQSTDLLVAPFFLARVLFLAATGGGADVILLRGLVVYFVATRGFAPMIELMTSLAPAVSTDVSQMHTVREGYSLPSIIHNGMHFVISILYVFGQYIYAFLIAILCAVSPIIFLVGAVLGIGLGLSLFLAATLTLSLWPLVWKGLNEFNLWAYTYIDDSFALLAFEAFSSLMSVVAPLVVGFLGANSGPAQAAIGVTRRSLGVGGQSFRAGVKTAKKFKDKTSSWNKSKTSQTEKSHHRHPSMQSAAGDHLQESRQKRSAYQQHRFSQVKPKGATPPSKSSGTSVSHRNASVPEREERSKGQARVQTGETSSRWRELSPNESSSGQVYAQRATSERWPGPILPETGRKPELRHARSSTKRKPINTEKLRGLGGNTSKIAKNTGPDFRKIKEQQSHD